MASYSSDASYNQHSPSTASVLGELKEAKRTISLKDEAIRRLEEKLQSIEMKQARSSHSIHGEHHHHRPSSRGSSNDHGREEEHRRRRPQQHFHGYRPHEDRRHLEDGYYQDAKAKLPSVKIPSFNGDSDPNVYLDWEAKFEQIFEIHAIQDEHKYKLATLEFSDYAMKWWHRVVKEIIYHKGPPVDSWNSLKDQMRLRFVPPHFRKDLMLRLQQFQKGTLSVDAYFKKLKTLLLKVNLKESEEAMIARFISGLRKDIQDVVELQEYSSLGSLVHLATKVEAQIAKKNAFKNSPNVGYYNNSWKNKKSFSNLPSKDFVLAC